MAKTKIFWGIEEEGGFLDCSKVAHLIKSDGSVRVQDYRYCTGFNWSNLTDEQKKQLLIDQKNVKVSGEINSPVFSKKSDFKKWLKEFHPDEVDYSCGLHCHFSFPILENYAALMSKNFFDHLVRAVNRFGDEVGYSDKDTEYNYWSRFCNGNTYAKRVYSPLGHYYSGGEKYSFFNYGAFTKDIHTFEARCFPMFKDKNITYKAIETLINCIDEYIISLADYSSEEYKNSLRILNTRLPSTDPLFKQSI